MPKTANQPVTLGIASPAYSRISADLRAKIASGRWSDGKMLPSRKALAAEYHVSVPTVERAVADLLADGTLRADNGRGTFVGESEISQTAESQHSRNTALTATTQQPLIHAGIITSSRRDRRYMGVADYWRPLMVNAFERAITGMGGMTSFFNQARDIDEFELSYEDGYEELMAKGVNAIAIITGASTEGVRPTPQLVNSPVPIVVVGALKAPRPMLTVRYDSQDAGYQAAAHLIANGCRRILYFSPYIASWVTERAIGAREAVRNAGLPSEALVCAIDNVDAMVATRTDDKSREMHSIVHEDFASRYLTREFDFDGVITSNDRGAIGFRNAAARLGFYAGEDYGLVGFDDHPDARDAGISSLHPPLEALGEQAARLINDVLSGSGAPFEICLPSSLVARPSSRIVNKQLTAV
ncbi:MAG TPA: GntR family transcriptional regulator [Capsulimonadaceae bacterium]